LPGRFQATRILPRSVSPCRAETSVPDMNPRRRPPTQRRKQDSSFFGIPVYGVIRNTDEVYRRDFEATSCAHITSSNVCDTGRHAFTHGHADWCGLADKQGIEAAGITARTPFYIPDFNSKVCYDLLKKVLALTRLGYRPERPQAPRGRDWLELMDKNFQPEARQPWSNSKSWSCCLMPPLLEEPNQISERQDYSKANGRNF